MHRYRPLVFAGLVTLCVAGFVLDGIASALPQHTTVVQVLYTLAESLLLADMVLVLVADWRGFVTLNGRINWAGMSSTKRFCLGCVAVLVSPLLLAVYLVQVARHAAVPPVEAVPPEVEQYMRDGDLRTLKQRIGERLRSR